jgi:hypothetical protein
VEQQHVKQAFESPPAPAPVPALPPAALPWLNGPNQFHKPVRPGAVDGDNGAPFDDGDAALSEPEQEQKQEQRQEQLEYEMQHRYQKPKQVLETCPAKTKPATKTSHGKGGKKAEKGQKPKKASGASKTEDTRKKPRKRQTEGASFCGVCTVGVLGVLVPAAVAALVVARGADVGELIRSPRLLVDVVIEML